MIMIFSNDLSQSDGKQGTHDNLSACNRCYLPCSHCSQTLNFVDCCSPFESLSTYTANIIDLPDDAVDVTKDVPSLFRHTGELCRPFSSHTPSLHVYTSELLIPSLPSRQVIVK